MHISADECNQRVKQFGSRSGPIISLNQAWQNVGLIWIRWDKQVNTHQKQLNGFKPSRKRSLTAHSKAMLLLWINYVIYVSCSCFLDCSLQPCAHLIGKGWPLGSLVSQYVMFNCVFVTFLCDVLGQLWCLVVMIPDLSYFVQSRCRAKVQSKWESVWLV